MASNKYDNFQKVGNDLTNRYNNKKIHKEISDLLSSSDSSTSKALHYLFRNIEIEPMLEAYHKFSFSVDKSFRLYLKICNCYKIQSELQPLTEKLGRGKTTNLPGLEDLNGIKEKILTSEPSEFIGFLAPKFIIMLNRGVDRNIPLREDQADFFSNIIMKEAFREAEKAYDITTNLNKALKAKEILEKYAAEDKKLSEKEAEEAYDVIANLNKALKVENLSGKDEAEDKEFSEKAKKDHNAIARQLIDLVEKKSTIEELAKKHEVEAEKLFKEAREISLDYRQTPIKNSIKVILYPSQSSFRGNVKQFMPEPLAQIP